MPARDPDQVAEIARLHVVGLSNRDIAAEIGCTAHTAGRIIRDLGLRPNGLREPRSPPPVQAPTVKRVPGFVARANSEREKTRERFARSRMTCACTRCSWSETGPAPEVARRFKAHACDGSPE